MTAMPQSYPATRRHDIAVLDSRMSYLAAGDDGPAVLFLHGAYDYTCETLRSRLAEPMRADCANLTEVVVPSGHWMAQEKPVLVNAAIAKWLAKQLPALWPT